MNPNYVFVFGSNLAGRHGAGAAAFAYKHYGAVMGKGIGHVGNSYGIPTKDQNLYVLELNEIAIYIQEFLDYARRNPDLIFALTPVGCGLSGFSPSDIKPILKRYVIPVNVVLTKEWITDYE